MKANYEPAFPRNHGLRTGQADGVTHTEADCFNDGISVRDYFAAAALQGILAYQLGMNAEGDRSWQEVTAADAYLIAKFMLAERAK